LFDDFSFVLLDILYSTLGIFSVMGDFVLLGKVNVLLKGKFLNGLSLFCGENVFLKKRMKIEHLCCEN